MTHSSFEPSEEGGGASGEHGSHSTSHFFTAAGHKLSSMLARTNLDEEQHPNLKVRIMTWNMHGTIPKGDLEILLGHCDVYRPEEVPPREEGMPPPLPMDNQHPYHMVVIACQECPWGEGGQLTTTLHTAGEIGSMTLGRVRAARDLRSGEHKRGDTTPTMPTSPELDRELRNANSKESLNSLSGGLSQRRKVQRPPLMVHIDDIPDDSESPQSPRSEAGFSEPKGGRGWSKICEDWYCRAKNPTPIASPVSSPMQNREMDLDMRTVDSAPSVGQMMDRAGMRSSSGNVTPSAESQVSSVNSEPLSPPVLRNPPRRLGPYELVIKERMMGCYSAVYVWRPCRDLVHGASSNMVKSGLLAGRMGNKGGVGISIHFGTLRLLFVNAHLAARFDNVTRIQNELRVDTFLPPDDPRNKLEDITEKFDHVFWCGDLNFRVDITRKHADWLIQNKSYDHALAFDQLRKAMREGRIFKGFDEAPIRFPPTYKFDILRAQLHHEGVSDGRASVEESFDSPRAQRSMWKRMLGRSPKEGKKAHKENTATLGRSTSQDSLSNVSESSSIMEEATQALRQHGSLSNLAEGTTEKPMDSKLASVMKQTNLRRRTSAASSLHSGATYDSSAKKRVPSWCDRVLYRSNGFAPRNKRRSVFSRRHSDYAHQSRTIDDDPANYTDASRRSLVHAPLQWLHAVTGRDETVEAGGTGHITVLEYRSIDDAEVELLGARSDHRPVILSAAIGL